MRIDRNEALKLRLQGRSYNEISRLLDIPKSTLSCWFTGLELSKTAQERIKERVNKTSIAALIKRNHAQTYIAQKNASRIRIEAKKEILNLTKRDIFMVGLSLYWAEGYKRPKIINGKVKTYHPVTLSNSDPGLVKIYLKFLREVCEVLEENITGEVSVYNHHNKNYLLNFWNEITKIDITRLKSIDNGESISSKRVRPYNILPYGTIQIRVNSTKLYHKIMGWIEGLSNSSTR